MEYVENYFQSGVEDPTQRVRLTNLPPIYFQHAGTLLSRCVRARQANTDSPGHSMTVIGFERQRNGAKNLIIFDPMFHDASNILKLVGRKFEYTFADTALKPYRRGSKYLRRYREFEVLRLVLQKSRGTSVAADAALRLRAPTGGFPALPSSSGGQPA